MTNDCETVIAKSGWGLCNYFIVGLCGMCTLAEAGASLIVPIVTPLLVCDMNLNASEATTMHATSTFGMVVGAFLFGTISDAKGRKGTISITLAIVFCASIFLSFARNSFLINLSIFILGAGIGYAILFVSFRLAGNNVVLRVYLIECLPVKRRGVCLAILDLLWIVGYLSALGISWSLLPSILSMQNKRFRPNSWRVLAGLGGTPNLVMACTIGLLPSSPRYLLYRRRQEEALAVLRQMYAINGSKHADTYSPRNLDNCVRPDEDDQRDRNNLFSATRKFWRRTFERVRELFQPPFKRITILGTVICFLHFPGFVWLALWNTRINQEMERERMDKLTGKNATCIVDAENMALGFLHDCQGVNSNRFEFLLYFSLSYVLGEILLCSAIDIIGRKFFLISSGIIGAAASFGLTFTAHRTIRIVLSSIFLATYAIGRTTTTTLLLENYPTGLRGTIIGFTRTLPYTASSFTKLFLNVECVPSIIVASGLLLGASIAGFPLRDLTGAPMQE